MCASLRHQKRSRTKPLSSWVSSAVVFASYTSAFCFPQNRTFVLLGPFSFSFLISIKKKTSKLSGITKKRDGPRPRRKTQLKNKKSTTIIRRGRKRAVTSETKEKTTAVASQRVTADCARSFEADGACNPQLLLFCSFWTEFFMDFSQCW